MLVVRLCTGPMLHRPTCHTTVRKARSEEIHATHGCSGYQHLAPINLADAHHFSAVCLAAAHSSFLRWKKRRRYHSCHTPDRTHTASAANEKYATRVLVASAGWLNGSSWYREATITCDMCYQANSRPLHPTPNMQGNHHAPRPSMPLHELVQLLHKQRNQGTRRAWLSANNADYPLIYLVTWFRL